MKILITGSLGRIASRVVPLLPDHYELKLTDIREGEVAGLPASVLDITDYKAVLAASRGMDAILHLAITSERDLITDKEHFYADEGEEYLRFNETSIESNIRGTYHIYEAARQNRVSRVVYGSSLTVFLGKPDFQTTHDDMPPCPSNFYGVTKLWGEQPGEYFSRKYDLRVYCLRFGTPHPMPEVPLSHKWMEVPVPRRTFVSHADLARAITAALNADSPPFGAYTIVSATPSCAFDVSKASEIGWTPRDFIEADGSVRPLEAEVEEAVFSLSIS